MARFGNDDGYLVGPASVVFPAQDIFSTQVREKCLLRLQVTKTEVFTWRGELPIEAPQGIAMAGSVIDGVFNPGFLCYGIRVGIDKFVKDMLDKKVSDIEHEAEKVKAILKVKDIQAVWSILHCSLTQKLDWHLSLCYPSDIMEAAIRLDHILWSQLEYATNLHIPKMDEGLKVECVLDIPGLPVDLQTCSFQHWLVRQTIR